MRWIAYGCVALFVAAAPMAAQAGVVTLSETVDLNDLPPGGGQETPPFSPAFSVEIAEGDTFDLTIDFIGDQTLTLDGLFSLWAFSYATTSSEVMGTGTLSLLGADGTAFLTSDSKTDIEGDAHFGQQFFAGDFTGLPASVTFYGVRYVGVLEDYIEDGVTTRTYNDPAFYYSATTATITGGAVVPEPSTWAMMIMGFGLAGAMARRRRSLFAA